MQPVQGQIYYGIDGQRYGPVAPEQIRELVKTGRLRLDDYLWDDERDDWIAVSTYPQLAELAQDVESGPRLPVNEDGGEAWREPAEPPETPSGYGFAPARDLLYAGFWIRLLAHLIDVLVLFIPVAIWTFVALDLSKFDLSQVDPSYNPFVGPPAGQEDEFYRFQLYLQAGAFVLEWLYHATLESSVWQATVGKRVMGIVVTDTAGHRVNFLRASIRHWSKLLSQMLFYFGFLMIAISSRRQGLHDKIADTLVVRS